MASEAAEITTANAAKEPSTFLTIAQEIRLRIYREVFNVFTVHMSTEFETIDQDTESEKWSPQQCVETDVDVSLLLSCKQIHAEAQVIYDESVRLSLACDTSVESIAEKMYSPGFHKRITWLSISEEHETDLHFDKSFPKLKKLEIEQGGNGKVRTPRTEDTEVAPRDGSYEEVFKTQIKDKYLNLPPNCWQREALDNIRGKVQVTHIFSYEPPAEPFPNVWQSKKIVVDSCFMPVRTS